MIIIELLVREKATEHFVLMRIVGYWLSRER